MNPSRHILKLLREHLARVQGDVEKARAGDDPEALHQARIGLRRMRSLLRSIEESVPGAKFLRATLRPIAGALGEERNRDVLIGLARQLTEDATRDERALLDAFCAKLESDKRGLRSTAFKSVSPRKIASISRTLSALKPDLAPTDEPRSLEDFAREAVRALHRRVRRRSRGPWLQDRERLHGLRIATKELRYVTEALLSELPGPAKKLSRRAAQVQDVLGEVCDLDVLLEALTPREGEASPPGLERLLARGAARRLRALERAPKRVKALRKRKGFLG